ncbi:acyclic terpene utilization AtuA family protein [Catenulispora pinisilvae]|uniref:acyclic terpene utilization AtuA family protein n=1 Tax=Catenulispora pinisilvae TaxID=2705253 RepID=UPI0018920294|nr:acyclic terpene utilization AtuA family protein [Catenulispora pinisilvae]
MSGVSDRVSDWVSQNQDNQDILRIGNASGFYGDRFSAVRELLEGGELDVLTGDYLAELTMLILGRDRMKNPDAGYAKTFLRQMEDALGLALERGVKIVTNAGGLNPAGLADRLREVAAKLGLAAKVAHVEGDNLLARSSELGFAGALTANAYLGGFGIARCLQAGADVVVTGRVTDASLVLGPAVAHFGWQHTDHDRLAGAVAAGHVIECGAQATGGNYAFFTEIADLRRPGFPIAEVRADGSSVITKHPGTGGAVSVGTVTAQLLYEITGHRYANPDVTTRLDTVTLTQEGPDRVRITGVVGEAPPPQLKVALNRLGGFRNQVDFVLTGLAIEAKADLAKQQLLAGLTSAPESVQWTLVRTDRPDADTEETASALLRCVVRDQNADTIGRAFSGAAVELALSGYPGFNLTTPPGAASPYGVYTAAYVDAAEVPHVAVLPDGERVDIAHPALTLELKPAPNPVLPQALPTEQTHLAPLGLVFGARSGDKGGDANVGVWARGDEAWRWLAHELTVERFKALLPETAELAVTRHVFPNLRAVNFVVEGILGAGVAAQARFDPQAKGLGEWLRSRAAELPVSVLKGAER